MFVWLYQLISHSWYVMFFQMGREVYISRDIIHLFSFDLSINIYSNDHIVIFLVYKIKKKKQNENINCSTAHQKMNSFFPLTQDHSDFHHSGFFFCLFCRRYFSFKTILKVCQSPGLLFYSLILLGLDKLK